MVTSCATPNFPYAPFQGRRIKGFDLLAEYLWPEQQERVPSFDEGVAKEEPARAGSETVAPPTAEEAEPSTEFMLFLGDFIYADVPLYFGDDVEAYRRLYRRNYQSESFRKLYERLRESHFKRIPEHTNMVSKRSFTHTMIMR